MARTGYKIITYLDDNPNSPTYMETYEVREYDDVTCPTSEDDWVLIANECEVVLTGYTGYRIRVYQNFTTGEYREEKELDPECEETSTEAVWVNVGDAYCETTDKGVNTGYKLQLQRDSNPNSPTYNNERTQRWKDPECGDNACPIWDEVSRTCHISVLNCVASFDGTADVVQIDVNPLSESYNRTRTINVEDASCDNCTNTAFEWVDEGEVCGDEDPICSNGITDANEGNFRWRVAQDEYICDAYDKYAKEIRQRTTDGGETWIDVEPIKTRKGELIEAQSEDCTRYEWQLVEGDYLCVLNGNVFDKYQKLQRYKTTSDGTEWIPVIPFETKEGELIESDSQDCLNVPEGYTKVGYIENNSNAYLDLDILQTEKIPFKIEGVFSTELVDTSILPLPQTMIGFNYSSPTYNGTRIGWNTIISGGSQVAVFGAYSSTEVINTAKITDNDDGTKSLEFYRKNPDSNKGDKLALFCMLINGSPAEFAHGRFYSLKVYKNDIIESWLVPCKRNEDNMVGMYDIVRHRFFYHKSLT